MASKRKRPPAPEPKPQPIPLVDEPEVQVVPEQPKAHPNAGAISAARLLFDRHDIGHAEVEPGVLRVGECATYRPAGCYGAWVLDDGSRGHGTMQLITAIRSLRVVAAALLQETIGS